MQHFVCSLVLYPLLYILFKKTCGASVSWGVMLFSNQAMVCAIYCTTVFPRYSMMCCMQFFLLYVLQKEVGPFALRLNQGLQKSKEGAWRILHPQKCERLNSLHEFREHLHLFSPPAFAVL